MRVSKAVLATFAALSAFATATVFATTSVTIERGDTLSSIARSNGVSVAELVEWNGLDNPDLIIAGQQLVVSYPDASNTTVSGDLRNDVHVVTAGETLSLIAHSYGASVAELVAANELANPDRIRIGQQIRIRIASATPSRPAQTGHEIRPGDTLFSIARKYGVSVEHLVKTNSLASADQIRAGENLVISAPAPVAETPSPSPASPSPVSGLALAEAFEHWALSYGVPQDLLEALAWKESDWQPSVTGANGELGITQLSPDTIEFIQDNLLGFEVNALGVSGGVQLGARYLRLLLDRTDSEREALSAWAQGLWSFENHGMSDSGAAFADDVLEIRHNRQ